MPLFSGMDLMYLFGHFLDTLNEVSIIKALIVGFCRLVVGGHYTSEDLVSKLMLKFFNPATDPEINQILGIFFETLTKRRRQECLQKALIHTLFTILDAPNDSPLQDLKPETIIKFVINSTLPAYTPGVNIHNEIATSFLQVMSEHASNKDLLKMLSKELLSLEISDDDEMRKDLREISETLLDRTIDGKTEAYIKSFQDVLAGTYKGPDRTRTTIPVTADQLDLDEVPTDDEADDGENKTENTNAEVQRPAGEQSTVATIQTDATENPIGLSTIHEPTDSLITDHDHTEGGISSIYPSQKDFNGFPSQEIEFSLTQRPLTSTQLDTHSKVNGHDDQPSKDNTEANKSKAKSRGRPAAKTKPAREREAASSEEEDRPSTAKVRKISGSGGKKAAGTRGGKAKGQPAKSDSDSNKIDDDDEGQPDDASKENILDSTVR